MKNMWKCIVILYALTFFFATQGFAVSASSETSLGSYTFIEDVNIDSDFEKTPKEKAEKKKEKNQKSDKENWVWNFEYTYTQTDSTQANSTNTIFTPVVDETTEIDINMGGEKTGSYSYGGGLTYAITPEESMKDFGPNIYFGETYLLAPEINPDDFVPSVTFKVTMSNLTYVQTFHADFTILKRAVPVSGSSTINQSFPQLEATLNLIDPLTIKGMYTYYFYDRNVNDFLNNLNSTRAVSVGANGFANAISGFPLSQTEVDLDWFPLEDWEFDEQATDTVSATDLSQGYTFKEIALYTLNDWKFGASYEYETSETLTDHIYSVILKWVPQ